MKPNKNIITLPLLFSLISCSTTSYIKESHPNREEFSFKEKTTGLTHIYFCRKKGSQEKTQENAQKAHAYVVAKIDKKTKDMINDIFNRESFSFFQAMGASMGMNANAKALSKEVENKFKCLLIDTKD